MRYIELNPVRAGMVDHPGAYRWSSYRCNAQGEADELIRPHAVFTALDADPRICGERHRGLFLNALEPGDVGRKRAGTNDSAALGDDRSAARLASVLSRREIVELGSDPYSPRRVLPRLSARHSLSGREIDDLVDILSIQAELVESDPISEEALRDDKDPPVLGTLLAGMRIGNLDDLITGDKDLLPLANTYPIVTPAEFWSRHGGG